MQRKQLHLVITYVYKYFFNVIFVFWENTRIKQRYVWSTIINQNTNASFWDGFV